MVAERCYLAVMGCRIHGDPLLGRSRLVMICSDSDDESLVDSDEAQEEGSEEEDEDEEEEGKDWDELEEEAKR